MSNGVFKAVITDNTAQELLEAVRSQNVGQREMRDLMSAQYEVMKGIQTALEVGNTIPILIVPVTYNGASYALDGVTVAEIDAAINSGVTPIMRIIHEENAFFMAYSRKVYHPKTGAVLSYQFDADKNCPDGAMGTFSIDVSKATVTKSPAYELQKDCRNLVIYVGDAEDVDAAIAENAAKMLERERATWRLAQSVANL